LKKIRDYIQLKYNNLCSAGCIVPIEIISNSEQNLVLKELSVKYEIGGGLENTINTFYDLSEVPSKISADYQMMRIDFGNFTLPSEYGEYDFQLKLDGERIFSEQITIRQSISKALKPRVTALGVPTRFQIIPAPFDALYYEWDFGDSENATTTNSEAMHIYSSAGQYNLKFKIVGKNGLNTTSTFSIQVYPAEVAINSTLEKRSRDVENIENQLANNLFSDE
jgi:hypothetical protein